MIGLVQIRQSGAAHAHKSGSWDEVREPVALLFKDAQILITQSEVERQTPRNLPIVLREKAVVVGEGVAPRRAEQDRRYRRRDAFRQRIGGACEVQLRAGRRAVE